MYERGSSATSMDDVLDASGSGKSQLYHYFADRQDLVRAVVGRQTERVLAGQPHLVEVRSWGDLQAWAEEIVAIHAGSGGPYPCPLGSLAAETRADPSLRAAAAAAFEDWLTPLTRAFEILQHSGEATDAVDARRLAIRVLSALQGAMLIASTLSDRRIIDDVLTAQLAAVRAS